MQSNENGTFGHFFDNIRTLTYFNFIYHLLPTIYIMYFNYSYLTYCDACFKLIYFYLSHVVTISIAYFFLNFHVSPWGSFLLSLKIPFIIFCTACLVRTHFLILFSFRPHCGFSVRIRQYYQYSLSYSHSSCRNSPPEGSFNPAEKIHRSSITFSWSQAVRG